MYLKLPYVSNTAIKVARLFDVPAVATQLAPDINTSIPFVLPIYL